MDEQERREPERRPMYQGGPENPYESVHTTRQWRACCVAPIIAIAAVLLITVVGGLFSPQPRFPGGNEPASQDPESTERRAAFVEFGKEYFAIAHRADTVSESAFQELENMMRGTGSIDRVHSAFGEAAEANGSASEEFAALSVPQNLMSQSKLRQSLDTMSRSYDVRRQACITIVEWQGDTEDSDTATTYQRQVQEINSLTMQGLGYLGEAADDNGLTRDDVQQFLPAASVQADQFPTDMLRP